MFNKATFLKGNLKNSASEDKFLFNRY